MDVTSAPRSSRSISLEPPLVATEPKARPFPVEVLDATEAAGLSVCATALAFAYVCYQGCRPDREAFPSTATAARRIGASQSSVRRARAELLRAGVLTVLRERPGRPTTFRLTPVTLTAPPVTADATPVTLTAPPVTLTPEVVREVTREVQRENDALSRPAVSPTTTTTPRPVAFASVTTDDCRCCARRAALNHDHTCIRCVRAKLDAAEADADQAAVERAEVCDKLNDHGAYWLEGAEDAAEQHTIDRDRVGKVMRAIPGTLLGMPEAVLDAAYGRVMDGCGPDGNALPDIDYDPGEFRAKFAGLIAFGRAAQAMALVKATTTTMEG